MTTLGLSLLTSVSTLPRVARDADMPLLRRLLLGSLFGLPAGAFVFAMLDVDWLKLTAGVCILLFALPLLMNVKLPLGQGSGVGFASGLLGSGIGMAGPPIVLYLRSRRIGKDAFRGTSIVYYSIVNAISFALQPVGGRVHAAELGYAILLVPAIFAGQALGAAATRKLDPVRFRRASFVLLVATGVQAVVSGL
ncbi:sulfite exporter TauE/SafE family protein [Paenibacillus sp. GYB003]|uniref:sulfite exporter TauE/SafE family protein n=1 Tax=Paenibacillus sp. GYB003 TaxID=2994392 RepID=UPI002F96E4BB